MNENIIKNLENLSSKIELAKDFQETLKERFVNHANFFVTNPQNKSINNLEANKFFEILNLFNLRGKFFLTAIATIFIATFAITISFARVNNSKPGDTLYALDRSFETIQVEYSKLQGSESEAETYLNLAQERVSEMQSVLGLKNNNLALIKKVNAHEKEIVAADDELHEDLEVLVSDYANALEKAQNVLDLVKRKGSSEDKANKLANTILESEEELKNILVTIRGKVDSKTSFIIDEAISITIDYQGETHNLLYFKLENGNDEENQALPESKVENRIAKAKLELEAEKTIKKIENALKNSENVEALNSLAQAKVEFEAGNYEEALSLASQILVNSKTKKVIEKKDKKERQETKDQGNKNSQKKNDNSKHNEVKSNQGKGKSKAN